MPKILLPCLPMLVLSLLAAAPLTAQPQLNEIRIDQSGTDDDEYFELTGTPSSSLDGFTYLVIGDCAWAAGSVRPMSSRKSRDDMEMARMGLFSM